MANYNVLFLCERYFINMCIFVYIEFVNSFNFFFLNSCSFSMIQFSYWDLDLVFFPLILETNSFTLNFWSNMNLIFNWSLCLITVSKRSQVESRLSKYYQNLALQTILFEP